MVNPLTGQPGFSLQDESLAWAAKLHAHVDLSPADMKSIAWILETLVREHPSADAARDLAEYVRDTDFKYGANRKGAKSLAVKCLAALAAPVPDIDVAQDDLREILRAVGLSDSARPYSPHEVVHRELLPHLRALRTVIEKYDGNSNNPYWADEFNQAMRIARERLDKTAAPVPDKEK